MAATPDFTNLTKNPDVGTLEDGYWQIELPWNIYFLTSAYYGQQPGINTIYVGTNSYITVGGGSTTSSVSSTNPPYNKLMIGAANNTVTDFIYKVIGTAPNRIAYIKYTSKIGSFTTANVTWEAIFREDNTRTVTINVLANTRWTTTYFGTALYGLYYANGTLQEAPSGFGAPGVGYVFELQSYYPAAAKVTVPGSLDGLKTLFVSGNENSIGTAAAGVVLIGNPGMPVESLSTPIPYASGLSFHSGLPYIQIVASRQANTAITFPGLTRTIFYWTDPDNSDCL